MTGTREAEHLKKRLRAEKRFVLGGRLALGVACLMLAVLLGSIVQRGWQGFVRTEIQLTIGFDLAALGVEKAEDALQLPLSAYQKLVQHALGRQFPGIAGRTQRRELFGLVSSAASDMLAGMIRKNPALLGGEMELWLPASSDADMLAKGHSQAGASDDQTAWLSQLREEGKVRQRFNGGFFTQADSRDAERAGFLGGIAGSLLTLAVCIAIAFPVAVLTAVYLEEFARPSRLVDWIEVNINNLAAVPSIVFGLLGLAVYINLFGLPRSAALVGGLTLGMMVLPVIIIASRSALRSVPQSIRDAARALGASPVQVVLHHVLPLSIPGIMTGTILGMARAIGETAPLLMIGMVAFVADVPSGFTDPATVMPVQIYLWATSPEIGYIEKTAAGILVLLGLLLMMNALAIFIRQRFEVRW